MTLNEMTEQTHVSKKRMKDLFVAQFAKPPDLEEMNLSQLTPFQRALLVIDGTVTQFIEAYTFSPIEVVLLHQETQTLSTRHVWLDAEKRTEVVSREVVLQTEAKEWAAADRPRLRDLNHCAGSNLRNYQRRLDAQRSRFRTTLTA